MSYLPSVARIKNREELDAVLKAATEDNHSILLPTHVVRKNGEIVGAASMNAIPVMMIWNHSQRVGARDSIQIKHIHEAVMAEITNGKAYVILCDKDSPYNPMMKSLGYKPFWETEVFIS
jgi:hypothetical protein